MQTSWQLLKVPYLPDGFLHLDIWSALPKQGRPGSNDWLVDSASNELHNGKMMQSLCHFTGCRNAHRQLVAALCQPSQGRFIAHEQQGTLVCYGPQFCRGRSREELTVLLGLLQKLSWFMFDDHPYLPVHSPGPYSDFTQKLLRLHLGYDRNLIGHFGLTYSSLWLREP